MPAQLPACLPAHLLPADAVLRRPTSQGSACCLSPDPASARTPPPCRSKLLTGELEAGSGFVWKHPNLRVAYVAQHAFHHIENHLDMSPNQYIQWRYATGEDRESLDKVSRKVSKQQAAGARRGGWRAQLQNRGGGSS